MEALDASEGRGSLLSFLSPEPISEAVAAGNVLEVSVRGLPVFSAFGLYFFPGFIFFPWECGVERGMWWGWLNFG